mmetsp:Transcript_16035/g.40733  ORF Transcript_16035/g.40733 Transcript_16035/m.40733 type:complete len:104 (-) Transcript_16035:289-600(-)
MRMVDWLQYRPRPCVLHYSPFWMGWETLMRSRFCVYGLPTKMERWWEEEDKLNQSIARLRHQATITPYDTYISPKSQDSTAWEFLSFRPMPGSLYTIIPECAC